MLIYRQVPKDFGYTNNSWPDVERDHAAVIHYLDEQVGQIMAALKQLGVDDNTMVVFAADNGAHQEGKLAWPQSDLG